MVDVLDASPRSSRDAGGGTVSEFDDHLFGYPPDRHVNADDDLECPECGATLELVGGGMFECPVCHFYDDDPAEE